MQEKLSAQRQGAGCDVVVVDGELDMLSASVLYAALATFSSSESVVVDCSRIDFMDSYGLAVLLRRRRELEAGGGSLSLRNPSNEVLRILAACGTLDGLIEHGSIHHHLEWRQTDPALRGAPSAAGH